MTNTKKLLIALLATSGMAQAGFSLVGFDYSLLRPLITKSKSAVEAVTASLEATKAACPDLKAYAKNLYTQQKNALKMVKTELKQAYKKSKLSGISAWFAEKQLYKAYKKFVYANWKKTRLFPTF